MIYLHVFCSKSKPHLDQDYHHSCAEPATSKRLCSKQKTCPHKAFLCDSRWGYGTGRYVWPSWLDFNRTHMPCILAALSACFLCAPAGVRRVYLIHKGDGPVRSLSKLIFGVNKQKAAPCSLLLPKFEQLQSCPHRLHAKGGNVYTSCCSFCNRMCCLNRRILRIPNAAGICNDRFLCRPVDGHE